MNPRRRSCFGAYALEAILMDNEVSSNDRCYALMDVGLKLQLLHVESPRCQ